MQESKRNLRFNILTAVVYVVGIILLLQLFNLQIIHGEEYRERSNNRLTREVTVKAARGNIWDRTGILLAGTKMGSTVQLYKSKIETDKLNLTIINIINVLEKNGDKYIDNFPIKINPYEFKLNEEELKNWKEKNKINVDLNAEEVFNIYKEKYKIESENIEEIRKIIGLRYEIEKTGYSSTRGISIATDISRASALEFMERAADFPGVDLSNQPIRNYEGTLACHVIGYVGPITEQEYENRIGYSLNDYIGKIGIEYVLEEYLKGTDGTKQIDMAIDGSKTAEYITQEAIAGNNVVLTIDANLQAVSEQALKNNIEKIKNGKFATQHNVKSGAVIVTNVKTGEVLALASYPTFESQLFVNGISNQKWNEYLENETLLNRALRAYQPGSIFKMVTAIAGLESGAITIDEKILNTGIYQYLHKPKCWIWTDYGRTHGYLNVSGGIKHSCNCYFYEVARRMGIENLEKYAGYFGLGKQTGIELAGEVSGTLAGKTDYEKRGLTWYTGSTLSAAIGQAENSFTPIQIAKYISMLTNGGKNIDITIIKDIIDSEGKSIDRKKIEKDINEKLGIDNSNIQDLDVKQENLDAVLEGMRSVTSETGGTAYSYFKNFNIEIGGKTGSAEAGKNINAWFVGFAPYDNPEIAVVVFEENGGHGSYTAEVARDIIAEYFGMNAINVKEDMTAQSYVN